MGNKTVRSLLVAAAAFAMPGVMTFSARAAEPESVSVSPARALDRAAELAASGKLIQARNMIDTVLTSQRATLSDEEHARVFSLIGQIEMGLRGLSATEVSLQKAEAALIIGDLRSAEAHANSVLSSKSAPESAKSSASTIGDMVKQRRADLTPRIKMDLSTAVDDFNAGNYAHAKMKLDGVLMSGVELSAGERRQLDEYRGKLADMAAATGNVSLGSFPVMDEKTDWLLQEGQPAAQPADAQPATDPIQESQRNEAMRILAEADQAFRDGRYAEAQTKYNRLMSQFSGFLSAEDMDHVEQQATSAALQLGRQPGANVLGETQQSLEIIRERARALYASQMEQARAARDTGDFGAASQSASEARLTAQRHRNVLPEEEYQQMLDEADQMRSLVDQARTNAEIAERERIEAELIRLQALRDDEQRAERQRLINENISRVRALQLDQKYDEALQVVDQILALDPLNPAGLLLRDVLEDTKIYRVYYTIQRDKALSYAHQTNQNEEALIAPETIIGYPSDWPQISFKRGEPMQFSESAVNRAVLATMQEKRIPVAFSDHAFGDVLQFYEQVSGLNVDIDWESLEMIGVDRESPVTLKLTNVSLETVLDRVLSKVSDPDIPAGWAVNDGILTIASDEVLRRNTLLEIYDIRDLLIDIPDYTNAPQFDLNSAFQNSGGGRGGGGGGGGGRSPFTQTGQGQGQQQGERRTREEMIDEIVDIITSNVDYDGWQENGGETGSIREFNGNLIITNTPRNHRSIIGLLRKLREVRALQISVEARFLLVSQDYFEQIGFDLDVYFNADNNEFQIARTLDPSLLPSDYFDPESGRLRRRVGSQNFDLNGDGTIGPVGNPGEDGDFVPVFSPGTQGDDWSLISGSQNSFDLTNLLSQGSTFASQILSAAPALGISGQFLDDIQVDFLIEATQADRRSVSLNAPRLTFTNGQTANIFVTSQRAYVSDLEPVTSQGAVAFDPVIDVINDGVTLLVDGVVSADRRYVTLNVVANVSQLVDLLPYETRGGAGGGGLGGGEAGEAVGVIQQPIVAVTGVNTTVTVPDQGTIMLGGQRLVSELQVETGVPVLSKIPILSRFFSNRIDSKEEQTLLILLKPTILIQNEQEEDNFPGLLDALGG